MSTTEPAAAGSEPALAVAAGDTAERGASPYAGRSHAELAELARELLLARHLIDRSGMPHLISRFGRDGMRDIAIDEWMAASPIYTKRMQRLLGFEGDTVETIFKGMQLDVGSPPEFMDLRYVVHGDTHGEFRLDHCGALMDVEPMGDDYVQVMCHDIEDLTFDATATASNPRAKVRPIHRPPRVPADRVPHCAWTVTIVEDAEPFPYPAQAEQLSTSNAAHLPLASAPDDLSKVDGWTDYAANLDPGLVMEQFSWATLARLMDEVCLQGHLLSRGLLLHVAERSSGEEAAEIGAKQLCGIAGLTTKRLSALLGAGPDLDGIAAVLDVHPMFLPRPYAEVAIDRDDDGLTWPAVLVHGSDGGLRSAVQCLAPQGQVERIDPVGGAAASWRIWIDPDAEPAQQADEVTLTEFSTGAGFHFERRGDRGRQRGVGHAPVSSGR